jgi:hypothetical protein
LARRTLFRSDLHGIPAGHAGAVDAADDRQASDGDGAASDFITCQVHRPIMARCLQAKLAVRNMLEACR